MVSSAAQHRLNNGICESNWSMNIEVWSRDSVSTSASNIIRNEDGYFSLLLNEQMYVETRGELD